jgi:hypothetical protein
MDKIDKQFLKETYFGVFVYILGTSIFFGLLHYSVLLIKIIHRSFYGIQI